MNGLDASNNEQEIPRAKRPNPLGYSPLKLATRDMAVRDMHRAHPTIPEKWLEWLWDAVENKPKEEVEKIINEGLWDKKLNENRQTGGVIKGACEVIPHQEKELLIK